MREELECLWQDAEKEIQELHARRVTYDDVAEVERILLERQDSIEYELGLLDFGEKQ